MAASVADLPLGLRIGLTGQLRLDGAHRAPTRFCAPVLQPRRDDPQLRVVPRAPRGVVTANRHPRKWRRLFAHAVFYEGWTLWCEQMMVDLRIDRSPWLRVQQLHDALWRCHRILVDLRLQTRRYSYAQAVRHMQKHLGFTRARAEADVNWYTASPAVPMSYWLGRLENARLHQRLVSDTRQELLAASLRKPTRHVRICQSQKISYLFSWPTSFSGTRPWFLR